MCGVGVTPWPLLLALVACSAPHPEHFAISVLARDAADQPVEDVRAWLDGRDLGLSDALGTIATTLQAHEGDVVSLAIACPPGYRSDVPTRSVPLRGVEHASGSKRAIAIHVRCERATVLAPLVVFATGPGELSFPVVVDGETIGQTDTSGAAHALLEIEPGGAARVRLDTSARPELRPASPTHVLPIESADSILLVAQPFEAAARRLPRKRLTSLAPSFAEPAPPYRIH